MNANTRQLRQGDRWVYTVRENGATAVTAMCVETIGGTVPAPIDGMTYAHVYVECLRAEGLQRQVWLINQDDTGAVYRHGELTPSGEYIAERDGELMYPASFNLGEVFSPNDNAVVECEEKITVPAGTYHTFKIVRNEPDGKTRTEWYSPEIGGGVKELVESDGKTAEIELSLFIPAQDNPDTATEPLVHSFTEGNA